MAARQTMSAAMLRAFAWSMIALLLPLCGHAAEHTANEVPAELWDRPRSGRTILAVPAVQRVLREIVATPAAEVTIRHAPGMESSGQAEELMAWLVAHAIDPERIRMRSDLPARQPIRLEVAAPLATRGEAR